MRQHRSAFAVPAGLPVQPFRMLHLETWVLDLKIKAFLPKLKIYGLSFWALFWEVRVGRSCVSRFLGSGPGLASQLRSTGLTRSICMTAWAALQSLANFRYMEGSMSPRWLQLEHLLVFVGFVAVGQNQATKPKEGWLSLGWDLG